MYFENYNDYTKEYRPGISKITRNKWYIRLDKDHSLICKRYSGNYTLHFSRKGLVTALFEYSYNKENKISKVIRYIYTYTKDQLISLIIGHDVVTSMLTDKMEFTYNSDNQIEEEYITEYLSNGEMLWEIECTHHYDGNYHEMRHYNSFYEELHISETWYDAETGLVEFKLSDEMGNNYDWNKKIYDKRGHLIREYILNENGTVCDESEYFYFPKKHVKVSYGERKNVLETLTEYDDKKNWKRKSYFENGQLYCVEEQTVEYY